MKLARSAALALTVLVSSGFAADAASISLKTKNYSIAGTTGDELLSSMNRKGPKHGFMSRAIAQTQYTVEWDVKIDVQNGVCRMKRARAVVDMTITYPQPSQRLSPAMQRKWNTFMVGVRKHEQQHASLARQMVNHAERSVAGVRVANDPTCSKTTAMVKQRVAAIYEEYEAKQIVFDRREHKQGGNIHRLIAAMTK